MIFMIKKNKTLTIVVTVLVETPLILMAADTAKGSFTAFFGSLVILNSIAVAGILLGLICWVADAVLGAKLRGDKVTFRLSRTKTHGNGGECRVQCKHGFPCLNRVRRLGRHTHLFRCAHCRPGAPATR